MITVASELWCVRWGKFLLLITLAFSDRWRVHWRQTLHFVHCCMCVRCTHSTLTYMSLVEWPRTGDMMLEWLGLRRGSKNWGNTLAPASYWRVCLLFKWSRRLIRHYRYFEFLSFSSKLLCFRVCFLKFPFFFVHLLKSSMYSFLGNVFISIWFCHQHGW